MRRGFFVLGMAAGVLAACQAAPTGYWYRGSLRVDSNADLFARFQRDRTICDGEAAQAALTSREPDRFTHNFNLNLIFDACLTKAGYIRRAG